MIPTTAEYALRAIVVLARGPLRASSAEQVAKVTRVPRRYVHKVLQALVRAELVRSQSGPGGGYALIRPPEDVTILDVVSAVHPIPRLQRCPLGLQSHLRLCPLHRELDQAAEATERAFARVTIAQLINQPDAVPALCESEQDGRPRRSREHRERQTRHGRQRTRSTSSRH